MPHVWHDTGSECHSVLKAQDLPTSVFGSTYMTTKGLGVELLTWALYATQSIFLLYFYLYLKCEVNRTNVGPELPANHSTAERQ